MQQPDHKQILADLRKLRDLLNKGKAQDERTTEVNAPASNNTPSLTVVDKPIVSPDLLPKPQAPITIVPPPYYVPSPDELGLADEEEGEASYEFDPNKKYIPRKYQIEGIRRLRELKRGICFDLPGLGKTLQASEAAKDYKPILVACPTYLTFQWYDFLTDQYPEDKIVIAEGPRIQRERILSEPADWYIVNIEMLAARKMRTSKELLVYEWPKDLQTFIIDESHHVRGREASQSKGALELAGDVERVILLTGTPQYKQVDDLFMQLRILDRKSFPSYNGFLGKYCRVSHTGFANKVLGPKNHQEIRALLDSYGIGRNYADVKVELPDLIRSNIPVVADPEFMIEYNRVRTQFVYNERDLNSLMEAMQVMRRMTAKVKLQQALEILANDSAETPEGIIFTWYKHTAQALASLLGVPCITGDVAAKDRKPIGKENKLVVATIPSMSEGVDMSHVSNVIFFEGSYVPGQIYQALSRVRRYRDNPAPVRASFIYVKNTIDELVHNAASQRTADIRKIMKAAILGDNE